LSPASAFKTHSRPNKTEAEYGRMLQVEFPGCEVVYEGITLKLRNNLKYTGDWAVKLPDNGILIVEVKNSAYKHASYGRSKMAYKDAQIDWPMFKFRWAEKHKGLWDEY